MELHEVISELEDYINEAEEFGEEEVLVPLSLIELILEYLDMV